MNDASQVENPGRRGLMKKTALVAGGVLLAGAGAAAKPVADLVSRQADQLVNGPYFRLEGDQADTLLRGDKGESATVDSVTERISRLQQEAFEAKEKGDKNGARVSLVQAFLTARAEQSRLEIVESMIGNPADNTYANLRFVADNLAWQTWNSLTNPTEAGGLGLRLDPALKPADIKKLPDQLK